MRKKSASIVSMWRNFQLQWLLALPINIANVRLCLEKK
jgi:hypothetical protein